MKNTPSLFSDLVNLRRDAVNPDVWRRVGMPARVADNAALPIAEFNLFGTSVKAILLANGRALYVATSATQGSNNSITDPLDAPRQFLGNLGGEPLEVESSVDGVVKIHCRDAAPEYVTYNALGHFILRGPAPQLPSIPLHASLEGTIYTDINPFKLTGATHLRGDSIVATYDRLIATEHLLRAYNYTFLYPERYSFGVQPVLARYRVRDIYGQTVFISAPVLAAPESGFQLTDEIAFVSLDNLASVCSSFTTARKYILELNMPQQLPAPWDSILSSVDIEASPQLDPVDADAICEGRCEKTYGRAFPSTGHPLDR